MSTPLVSAAYCFHPGCDWTAGPSDPDDPTGTTDVETRARRHHGDLTGSPTTTGHPVNVVAWPTEGPIADRATHSAWTRQTRRTLIRWTPPSATSQQPSSAPTSDAPSTPAAAAPRP